MYKTRKGFLTIIAWDSRTNEVMFDNHMVMGWDCKLNKRYVIVMDQQKAEQWQKRANFHNNFPV